MVNIINDEYKKGDFIRIGRHGFSFAIYEGRFAKPKEDYNFDRTFLAYYNEKEWIRDEKGIYTTVPFLEIAEDKKPCEACLKVCYPKEYYRKMSGEEKAAAIKVLNDYGYYWSESTLSVLRQGDETPTLQINTPSKPKVSYNGEVVKPMKQSVKDMLKNVIKAKNKTYNNYTHRNTYRYNCVTKRYEYD